MARLWARPNFYIIYIYLHIVCTYRRKGATLLRYTIHYTQLTRISDVTCIYQNSVYDKVAKAPKGLTLERVRQLFLLLTWYFVG